MKSPLDYLEELREKPESTRQTIAVLSVVVIMAIIVVVWILTLNLSSTPTGTATASAQPSPLALLWNYIKGFFGK